jgi:hypothetical protein
MGEKVEKEKQERQKKLTRETEQILQDAKVIMRWEKNPFYIS